MTDFDSLIAVTEDEKQSSYKRRQALHDLLTYHQDDERSYEAFRKVTQVDDAFLVREMVSSVKDIKAPKLLPILRNLLSVEDDYTKKDVIQILGKNGNADDLPILEAYCKNSSYSVSYAAKQAIATLEKSLTENASKKDSIAQSSIKDEEEVIEPISQTVEDSPEKDLVEVSAAATGIAPDLLNEQRDSLHDNSIFKDRAIDDAHQHYEDKSDISFSEVAPALFAENMGYENSKLKEFFGTQCQSMLALYKQLQECQKQLPAKEQKLSEARRRLTMLEADKADDIELSQTSVTDTSKKSKDLEWEIKKVKLDLENLDVENKKFFTSILNSFSEDRQRELEDEKLKLNKKNQKLQNELAESESELNEDNEEVALLKQPLINLQQELQACEHERDSCISRLMSVDREISEAYLKRLDDSEDTKGLLAFLKSKSCIAETIVSKLEIIQEDLRTSREEFFLQKKNLESVDDQATDASKLLGVSIEQSFQTVRTSAKEKVVVLANVNFKEEPSFFGGYSNASGSAQGKGSATMVYEISETKWVPVGSLDENIAKFRCRFEKLGEESTVLILQQKHISRLENQLRQYVDYIRIMIEGAQT